MSYVKLKVVGQLSMELLLMVLVKIYRTTGQRTFTAYFGKQWKQSLAVSVHYHLYKIKIFYELGEKNVVSI